METDIMLLPLPYLLDHTLSLPLLTQNHLVNSALLDHFLTSCHVTTHFLSLKRFLLLEDGEFAYTLSSHLFNKLRSGGGSRMTSPAFLNPLLQSALDSSLHGNSPNAELLTFAVSGSPPAHPHAVDALDFLQLQYEVEWPCNVVITEDCLRKYNRVFHLLLQLRRASWTLKTVFSLIELCEGLDKQQRRQLQIHRHEFQHFVGVMEGYITNQLFYLSWRELEEDLATKVHSLDDLIRAHQTFIDKAIFRCLLSKKAMAVMKIIQTVFSCILRFSTTLSSSALPSPIHLFHSLSRTHRKFRETAGLLMKVIIKLVERGYQPHLEDFLLRLNFNNFYG
jgi:gamma-tubulin complex component 6